MLRAQVRLSHEELRRRILHISPGLFPFFFHFVPQQDPLEAWSLWVVTLFCIAAAIGALSYARAFRRQAHDDWTTSVVSYVLIAPVLLWLFPGRSEIAAATIPIIAFGDGCATLTGMLAGRSQLPWNPEKSWAGSAAFVCGAAPFAVFAFWLQAHPAISLAMAFNCVAPAVVLAAITESLPSRSNDNLRIGVVAALTILALHTLYIGN